MEKNILIIKRSSLVISILALLGAAFCVIGGVSTGKIIVMEMQNYMYAMKFGYYIYAAVLVAAALIFFRIFRSGRPFTRGNEWAVRGIAGLFAVDFMVQALLKAKDIGFLKGMLLAGNESVFFVAFFLVIAEILRYGKLLQVESDETL
ncbi:MAG: hypothetical protein J6U00_01285 [Ruminococcus sp.]|uniref:DUF2975 domain-containing protein n=1 Tax=Ruminococcus sp. TaxID=41978 RepID=UPI001B29761A|nr:DUF2975 domain-containing protein [Ruminococcus sp.]MBO7472632.1 hypothetical protein [Ruminococcus sp.]